MKPTYLGDPGLPSPPYLHSSASSSCLYGLVSVLVLALMWLGSCAVLLGFVRTSANPLSRTRVVDRSLYQSLPSGILHDGAVSRGCGIGGFTSGKEPAVSRRTHIPAPQRVMPGTSRRLVGCAVRVRLAHPASRLSQRLWGRPAVSPLG